ALDGTCNGSGFSFSFTKLLTEGSYEITKQLSVNRQAMDHYREVVFTPANTCSSLEDFVNEQRSVIANIPCTANCDSCKAMVGSWDAFRNKFLENAGITTDTASYTGQARKAYEEAIATCASLCDEVTEYDDIRSAMLSDMTAPSGQYANIDDRDFYSIFNSIIPRYKLVTNYLDEEGHIDSVYDESKDAYVRPEELGAKQFAEKFKSSWAEQLLSSHPEYCKLQLYETYVKPSSAWAKKFEKVDTYAEAAAKGYLNPSNKNTGPFNSYNTWSGGHPDPDPMAVVSGFGSVVESGMTNYESYGVSIWQMAAAMVACPQGSPGSCYTNVIPFNSSDCDADKDMAWRNFRGIYLSLRKKFIDGLVANSDCSSASVDELLASEHQPHFISATTVLGNNGIDIPTNQSETDALAAAGKAKMNASYETTCQAYAAQWRKELEGCYDPTTLESIIEKMIEVCKNGADESHPFGASSISPTSTYEYESFQDVLDEYSASAATCTADKITTPKPYNQQTIYSAKPVWAKPDSCECEKINLVYTQYQADSSNYSGFADYMHKKFQMEFSDSLFNTLKNLCAGNNGSCSYLKAPILLPPVLQCYSGDVCVNCEKVDSVFNLFKQKYPGILPVNIPADSIQRKNNLLFENYFNSSFGFNKQASEYLTFLNSCNIQVTNLLSKDTLNKWLDEYKRYGGIPHYDAGGCDTTHWKLNYSGRERGLSGSNTYDVPVLLKDYFKDGFAQIPDSVQHPPNMNHFDLDYYDSI
ncbi:MAG: hypothetical protein J7497_12890, partial [Chitinophagaceae bacterium]|nr:hypothetical protein [Chitinophagaceae bacterium]